MGRMRSRCEWPGEERDELVGDSTRFDGCEDKLSSELSKARREEWRARERAGPDAANDDETAGSLGRWKGWAGKLSEAARQSSQPVRMEARQGRAGQGDWQVAGRSPMERLERFWAKALSGDPSVGCRDRLSRAQRLM